MKINETKIFEITEADLDAAIAVRQNSVGHTTRCLVAQFGNRVLGDAEPVSGCSSDFIWCGKDGVEFARRYAIEGADGLVAMFDAKQYTTIREQLPKTVTVTRTN